MIDFVDGNLAEKALTRAVIEVNQIGFSVLIPMSTYDRLPSVGERLCLNTYLHVRDDLLQLYGFATVEERALFQMLIASVSGVGPKLALNILSSMSVGSFSSAIVNKDIRTLSRISGIGKRSAERLIIELKDKIDEILPEACISSGETVMSEAGQRAIEDAVAGLITLGFKADAARKTIGKLAGAQAEEELTPENLIRCSLQILNS